MNDISEVLKGVKFKGFTPIEWDKVFKREAISYECGTRRNTLKLLLSVLCTPYISRISNIIFQEDKHSKILFFQSDNERKSGVKQFMNVTKLPKHSDILTCNGKRKINYHIVSGFKTIPFLFYWIKTLNQTQLTLTEKLHVISLLITIYNFQRKISFIEIRKYNLFVSFYDSLLFDAYLTEIFKLNKIATATLQHGAFESWRTNEIIHSGIELRSFHSDYFLCWNKYTVKEAIKCKINPSQLIITGIIGYIGYKYQEVKSPSNKIFGVVLGHPAFHQENIALIQAANLLAQHSQYKYYLKLHPNYKENAFNSYINNYYIGNIKKGIPIQEYANSVEFSLIGSSSVYIELIFIKHDTIRYSDGSIYDKFRDIHIGKYFSKVDDIIDVYKKTNNNNASDELFDILCTVKDIDAAYKNFFMKFE